MHRDEVEKLFQNGFYRKSSNKSLIEAQDNLVNNTSNDNNTTIRALAINTIIGDRHYRKVEKINFFLTVIIIILAGATLYLNWLLFQSTNTHSDIRGNANMKPSTSSSSTLILKNKISSRATSSTQIKHIDSVDPNLISLKDIILVLLGGLVAYGLLVFEEKLRKPILVFEKGSEDIGTNQELKRNWKFIHIKLKNKERKYKLIPIGTSTAYASKATITIFDSNNDKVYSARWTSKAEPLIYGESGKVIGVNLNDILVIPREDIHPSDISTDIEAVQIAVGIKYEDDNEFYGFNNESYMYQPNLLNQKLKLGKGIFEAEVTLSSIGYIYHKKFRIHNTSINHNDFWLEML